ncbi:MAG: hypothetical protein R3B82_12300 [Sandaracinaceae bacterium]
MLTRELMGLLALGILWLNGLLVVTVAFKQLGATVRAVRRRFREARERGRLFVGVVKEGEPIALRHVSQLGRAITTRGPERILFTDGPQSFEVLGGVVETGEGDLRVAAAQPGLSEVWVAPERAAQAGACPSPDEFDEAFGEASKYKGYSREIEIPIRAGDRVWIIGDREGDTVGPSESEPLFVSMVEPFGWAAAKAPPLALHPRRAGRPRRRHRARAPDALVRHREHDRRRARGGLLPGHPAPRHRRPRRRADGAPAIGGTWTKG